MIRERRMVGCWQLALLLGGSVLIAGCSRARHEAPEQRPIAPQVAPPTEQQDAERAAQRDTERARDEAPRCAVPAEKAGSQHARRHAQRVASGKDRKGTKVSDRKGLEGGSGFGITLGRMFLGGPDRNEVAPIRMGTGHDVVSKPITPAGGQQALYLNSMYMGTPDPTRRGMRLETGDAPAYSTLPPITPNVSEATVKPF